MAFRLGEEDLQDINEMNLVPLIDIMLVLMIVFMMTATILNPSVLLDLPQTSATVQPKQPKVIQISVDKDAGIYWDDTLMTLTQLETRMAAQSTMTPKPSIHLRVDKDARYETVAQILAAASQANLNQIAFVNE